MPPVSAAAQVRDDENLDELSRNETRPPAASSHPLPEGTLDALEDGLPMVLSQFPGVHGMARLDADTEEALAAFGAEPGEAAPVSPRLSRDQIVWLASGFLTLILMGMAGAALVFFHRAADIIALLR
jgi:hypothetical protein